MKFAANRTIGYTNDDRVLILQREEQYLSTSDRLTSVKYLCCALIEVTRDWMDDDEFPIVSDTDSIQIRPKGIFKSSKGHYYKSGKTIYLTDEEVNQMNEFINKFLNKITWE